MKCKRKSVVERGCARIKEKEEETEDLERMDGNREKEEITP